ncbi:LLM class F420-dependent oxidoreductase [Fodinicola acaciae]|uniref:LLM class F420-dependent oxidoreductase n=1 Tax=Fodinicola acaciae TaxID=2681555 RepID=UPI0013D1637A|nr:LLM class F420-dependent oxidoreductase [Fodinicola acaciae]
MRLSLSITNFSWGDGADRLAGHLDRVVRAADDAGIDTVWVPDHLLQGAPGSGPEDEMLEAYTTLGFLAARTTRVRLGAAVTGVTFRPPALLIKAVTTLDVLSGGRAWLGIGAGYHLEEAKAMGLPLPETKIRFEHLEDTLQLALRMWSGDASPFEGKHNRLDNPVNSPNSLQRPHPSILIGGTGEKKTLRFVAQYGDACNVFDIPDGGTTIKHKLEVLAGHCEDVGRPYDAIDKTVSTRLGADESAASFVERCAVLRSYGLDHVMVIVTDAWSDEALRTLSEAQPGVAAL